MEKNSLNNTASVGIIYHYPCYDGSYAALNAFLYYKNFAELRVKFFPSNSHNRISEVDCSKFNTIYILDKGLNEDDLEYILKILQENKNTLKMHIIDHHLSSIEFYEKNYKTKYSILENIEIIFDSSDERSASGLTFEYFKNKALNLGISKEQVENVYSENYKIVKFNLYLSNKLVK
jgi:oligoribonuclease NrnB/cAMP/cGMP phosphodiesterase (DHH superfamily)